jgi:hypothetical protein
MYGDDQIPPQLRLRNEVKRIKRTSSKFNKNERLRRRRRGFQALITVWLQVRVLPGPPRNSITYRIFIFGSGVTAPETPHFVARCHASAVRKLPLHTCSGLVSLPAS